ncbi:hypothetical protein Hanom_Chr08g00726171 [Helianthus anomalus]
MPVECALHHHRFVFSSTINEIIMFTGGEGSFWVNNGVFDQRWLVSGGYK